MNNFVGSNPTLRTKNAPIHSTDEFEAFLKTKITKKGYPLAEFTIEYRVKAINARAFLKKINSQINKLLHAPVS